jgi:hypothetical protein
LHIGKNFIVNNFITAVILYIILQPPEHVIVKLLVISLSQLQYNIKCKIFVVV